MLSVKAGGVNQQRTLFVGAADAGGQILGPEHLEEKMKTLRRRKADLLRKM
jgi:hypothetical protein